MDGGFTAGAIMKAILFSLAALTSGYAAGAVASATRQAAPAAPPSPCAVRTFEGSSFTVCRYERGVSLLHIALGDAKGPYGGFRALAQGLGGDAARVRFALNGGMYEADQRPVGLLIQDGKLVHAADVSAGKGNFYLLPNGVFSVDRDGGVRVEETKAFLARPLTAQWATQSGPLLMAGGKLHPALAPNGSSVLVRNGVGVKRPGLAYFVISNGPVSFGRFARFFRDGLGCPDALYLDGHISSLWAPGLKRQDGRTGLGPLIVVLRPDHGR
jgi:uncharacterized protein YigE (DUF2233 family)